MNVHGLVDVGDQQPAAEGLQLVLGPDVVHVAEDHVAGAKVSAQTKTRRSCVRENATLARFRLRIKLAAAPIA